MSTSFFTLPHKWHKNIVGCMPAKQNRSLTSPMSDCIRTFLLAGGAAVAKLIVFAVVHFSLVRAGVQSYGRILRPTLRI